MDAQRTLNLSSISVCFGSLLQGIILDLHQSLFLYLLVFFLSFGGFIVPVGNDGVCPQPMVTQANFFIALNVPFLVQVAPY